MADCILLIIEKFIVIHADHGHQGVVLVLQVCRNVSTYM